MSELVSRKIRIACIAIAVVFPSLVTWAYFDLLADGNPTLQKGTFVAGKTVQFLLPLLCVFCLLKKSIRTAGLVSAVPDRDSSMSTAQSIGLGVAMGLAVIGLMFVIFRFGMTDTVVSELELVLAERVGGFSIDTWQKFLGLSLFYALCHSFLEEYYYRWFVFGQLRHVAGFATSAIISGFAFMGHHVIVLAKYFGWSPMTAFLSVSIAIGGIIWAWQYEKSRSLLGPWLSHLLVDAGIFAIGYELLRNTSTFS